MSLLLDEIALATARLAEAGVESPRTDAELIAAHVHGVPRGGLTMVPDAAFDPRFWDEIARREAQGAAAAHHRARLLPLPGAGRRPRRVRAAAGDRGAGRLGHRPLTGMDVGRADRRRPGHRLRRDRAVHRPGGAQGPGARGGGRPAGRRPGHSATSSASRRPRRTPRAGSSLHVGDFADRACRTWTARSTWWSATRRTSRPGRGLPPEVGEYDPATALWGGGPDGLDAVRVVEAWPAALLRPGGLVAVEHGAHQGSAVYWAFPEEHGWRETRNHKDLAGRDRFVTAVRGDAAGLRPAAPATRTARLGLPPTWKDGRHEPTL